MLRGKLTISAEELLNSMDLTDDASKFKAVGSNAPALLRQVLESPDPSTGLNVDQRLELLTWTTALGAMPCSGLEPRITLRLVDGVDADSLPMTHTCSRELHMPPYTDAAVLRAKLLYALAYKGDGFQIG